jgi:hypothetical protein
MRFLQICVRFLLILAFSAGGYPAIVHAQEKASPPKSKTVVADADLKAGWLHRFFFGKGYRSLWTTPIEVEYLDLRNFAGGLTPTGTGKGMQSLGLRFMGADGHSYTFRPIKKSLLELVPEYFLDTFVEEIVKDQLKSAFPTAPPVIPVILDAVNVLHNVPRIIVIPDDPLLGEYRELFAEQVGTIEEWPNEGRDNAPGFAGATEIHSTPEMLAVLRNDPAEKVDVHNLLTARLVDLLIGDWDRHRGQWRWANVGEGTPPAWRPIPEDRDQAFARYDGALFSIVRQIAPQLTNFGSKYNRILGMTWNGRDVDRRLLTGLEYSEWRKTAEEVQTRVNDEVIADALKELPASHYELEAANIARNLKIRRDNLPEIAKKFYSLLAGEVNVYGTDASEIVEAVRTGAGFLDLSIYAVEDGEKQGEPHYSRRFSPRETKDVRLFLYGGDDKVRISGEGPARIQLRVISEAGRDEVIDSSKHAATRVYDSRAQGGVSVQGAKVDRRPYEPPKPEPPMLPPRDWGHMILARGDASINNDLGFLIGAGLSYERFAFRRQPFASKWSGTFSWATKLSSFRIHAVHERTWENAPRVASAELLISGIETINFYGFGNESPLPEREQDVDASRNVFHILPALTFHLAENWTLKTGLLVGYSKTDDFAYSLWEHEDILGRGEFWQGGIQAGVEFDMLDSHAWPSRGTYFMLKGEYYPEWKTDKAEAYGVVETKMTGVLSVSDNLALAGQLGGRKVWGDYPYYAAAYLGGSKTLRGYDVQRFAGDACLYANLDAHFPISKYFFLLPGEWGLFGFVDTGRVFYAGESSRKWHTGYGGGIWIAPLIRQYTMSLAVAHCEEDTRVYFSFGVEY